MKIIFSLFIVVSSILITVAGCQRNQAQIAPPVLPVIPVSKPVSRMVTEFVDFTGRANAVNSVNIIPRVTGYLVKMPFEEGSEVKAGDLLFEIDPRPYQAQFEAAKAKVAQSKAGLKLAEVTNVRFKELAKKAPGAVSQQDLDKYQAQEDEAVANLDLANANMASAQLNLDWTKVKSPIDGKVSRHLLTLGNLVNADQTLLTTVVSLEPMYAYFDMDEPTYLRIKRAINDGKINPPGDKDEVPVTMGMQGEDGYPHQGSINFVDNQVFPSTGSISWRGLFANPKPPGGTRLLAPGMFVRIRLPIGQEHQALLVIDRAVWSDQGLKNVYVVDAENKVQARRITTGPLQEDGLRVVEGLTADDWVVVAGLQEVRPRLQIQTGPRTHAHPESAGPGASAAAGEEEGWGGGQEGESVKCTSTSRAPTLMYSGRKGASKESSMAGKKYTYDYPRPAVTVDVVIVTREPRPRVLLIRRKHEPFAGRWAIPGGFVDMDEPLEAAARRELEEETGIRTGRLEQLHTFGDPGRDPRGRVISVVYLAQVDPEKLNPIAADDAAEVAWHALQRPPLLAFDHSRILALARQHLKKK